jgi:hypothetical protein
MKSTNSIFNPLGRICATSFLTIALPVMVCAETVGVFFEPSVEQIKFATGNAKAALEKNNFTVEMLPLTDLKASHANKKVVNRYAWDLVFRNQSC